MPKQKGINHKEANAGIMASDAERTESEKKDRIERKLPRGFSRFLLSVITIILTAVITWYVNFKLSHLQPIINITNVEFVYDIDGKKELVEIPDELVESDRNGFFGTGLKHFMLLEDLQEFTKKDRPALIEDRYRQFKLEIDVFLGLLENKETKYETRAQYALDFLRSNGFNGIASCLIYLEEQKNISPLKAKKENIDSIKLDNGSIMVAKNSYLLPNSWTRAAKTANQKFMAQKIEWFAERVVYNLVTNRYSELKRFLEEGKQKLEKIKNCDLRAENGIIHVIEQKARPYKRVILDFQVVNRSDFPILLHSEGRIAFENIDSRSKIITNGTVFKSSDAVSSPSANNLFNAIILNGKSSGSLSIKSTQISAENLDEIESLFRKNKLQASVEIRTKTEKGREKKFMSDWVAMNR